MNSFAGIFQEHTIKPETPEHGTPAEEWNTTGTPEHGTPAERKEQYQNNRTQPEHPRNNANTAE